MKSIVAPIVASDPIAHSRIAGWAPWIAAATLFYVEKAKWEKRAQAFDYSKLEDMESASVIFDRNNQPIGRIFIQNRDQVGANDLSSWFSSS